MYLTDYIQTCPSLTPPIYPYILQSHYTVTSSSYPAHQHSISHLHASISVSRLHIAVYLTYPYPLPTNLCPIPIYKFPHPIQTLANLVKQKSVTLHNKQFLPGQWLDVYVPGPSIPQAGGFTITCSPSKAIPSPFPSPGNNTVHNESQYPYLELAIQQSPLNPVASYLWQSPLSEILGQTLKVRVGGSFVFPPFPFSLDHGRPKEEALKKLDKVIFIAGGVGVNPLMSMLSYIAEAFPNSGPESQDPNKKLQVHFLYSVKDPNPGHDQPLDDTKVCRSQILFERISNLFSDGKVSGNFKLFLTQPIQPTGASKFPKDGGPCSSSGSNYLVYKRRISKEDIVSALGHDKDTSAVYICGVPAMTDYFVEVITSPEDSGGFGMDADRVLFEKWW